MIPKYYVRITSWRGICGIHFYGTITSSSDDWTYKNDVTLRHRIRVDDDFYDGHVLSCDKGVKKWTTSIAFKTEKEIEQAAIRWWKKNAPETLLFVGEPAICDPQELIAGPTRLVRAANKIWKRWESLGGWGYRPDLERDKKAQLIADEWRAFWIYVDSPLEVEK